MNWYQLTDMQQLEELKEASFLEPVLFFKHSTRCSISVMALNRFEREWDDFNFNAYLLDLLSFREVSNAIADVFEVEHQSPQILLIKNGNCVFHQSHNAISTKNLNQYL